MIPQIISGDVKRHENTKLPIPSSIVKISIVIKPRDKRIVPDIYLDGRVVWSSSGLARFVLFESISEVEFFFTKLSRET